MSVHAVKTLFIPRGVKRKFDYTTVAHRYTSRYPRLTYVGTQVNFWIAANVLLVAILHLHILVLNQLYNTAAVEKLSTMLIVAVLLGVVYGVILGFTSYYLDRKVLRMQALGRVILFKTFTSLALLIIILELLRYVLFNSPFSPWLKSKDVAYNEELWTSVFFLLGIYYFFMTLVISFVNQINKKYGPGILLPLLFGQYREPREEERIFMFMDLKSSTSTAEELGHLKYSAFIRDCFADINEVLYPFRAQVYQYVGDEIVVTWRESEGIKKHFCIAFYFACKTQFRMRTEHYMTNYGFLPDFKAGIHTGPVTTVEIGDVKRDIAYHGDTLNTAARLQGVCNDYNKNFLVSRTLLDKLGPHPSMHAEELGTILLKGKTLKIGLASVEWMEAT
jgi:adenylate cyclase